METIPVRDPGSILREALVQKGQSNPSFSLRSMARYLGVSHTYLSLVMSGKKSLSPRRAAEFSTLLKLGDELNEAVRFSTPAEKRRRPGRPPHVSYTAFEKDQIDVANWNHIAILDLTETDGFEFEASAVAKRLGLTEHEVIDAVERLQRVGLLKQVDGKLKKASRFMKMGKVTPQSSATARKFRREMVEKALEAYDALPSSEDSDFTGTFMAINPEHLPEAKRQIALFRKRILALLSQGSRTELYQLNVQLFNLSRR